MSLLTLTPEATRLRRVAKACAAGEVSRLEYREARHQLIDKFSQTASDGVEDTVPRFDLDITQRRGDFSVEPVQTAPRPNWFLWFSIFTVLVAALGLPLWTQAAAQIPPLKERDPNPRTSPTYTVTEVVWQPPADLAATLGPQVEQLLRTGLAEINARNAPAEHGFNAAELEDVGRFLNAIGVHEPNTQLTPSDLEDLRALVASQKAKRGISLIQLEQLAQRLQNWLREQGYPVATAYVPSQVVDQAQVQLGVQMGVVSSIRVAQSSSADLQYAVADMLGQRVERSALETRLNSLNRIEGIQTEVAFAPGAEVGDTELVLKVKQAQRFVGGLALDNYSVEDLGDVRVSAYGKLVSPRGVGDVLSVRAHTTLDPADHQYAQIGYASPVLNGRFRAAANLAYADMQLDGSTSVAADGLLFDAAITDTQQFTRTHRREFIYALGVHNINWDVVPDQRAWFLRAGLTGHRLFDDQQVALSGGVDLLAGGLDEARLGQDEQFWRVAANLNIWTPITLPLLGQPAKAVLDVGGQFSLDQLPPTLRFGAAGAYRNKGFSYGLRPLDQGVGVQGSLRFDAPVGQWWLFLDSTYGEQLGQATQWLHLTSAGIGWEGKFWQAEQGSLVGRLTLGMPIAHQGSGGIDDDGAKIYWSLRYAY